MQHEALYGAIADETRRSILDILRQRSLKAGEIARRFPHISRPAVSKHLAILRRSKLVTARREGREIRYSLHAAPLQEVESWVRRFQASWSY